MIKNKSKIICRLIELKKEKEKVVSAIGSLKISPTMDQIMLQRLRRRESFLRGEIKKAEANILPDIIA
ncbi:MAG: DUF465 domain-containing protein [Alphaproteobacteria bacterium]|nr:DUF465 domain-containing protein [Alphaproteobacteria bacterium]